jgi:MiaB/RimO family radical SAM methylthiotransferase
VQPLIGCLGNCYFCKTKLAKPLFTSYPLENILKRIDKNIKNGAKEIWISSEDNAAYGFDIGKNYMDLLNSIEERFKGKAMFRFGMSNPWLLRKHEKELINFFKDTKAFYKFLHIPIQSASSKVLKNMNRPYTEKQLESFFTKIRKEFKENELNLTTDIIVGYPTETKDDYLKTKKFIKKYKFLVANVSQIWPMPFTKTIEMKQLPTEIKKERSRDLSEFVRALSKSYLKNYVGKTLEIYFNDLDNDGNVLGRTKNYISVIMKKPKIIPEFGKWSKHKIKAIENFHLLV